MSVANKQNRTYVSAGAASAVGNLALDRMHEEFRDLLDLFDACEDTQCAAVLGVIQAHLGRQSAAEEEWMRISDDPDIERHKHEHDFWLDVIGEVRQRVEHGDIQIAHWLSNELSHWFETHRRESDSALVDFLQSRRDARCVIGERGTFGPRRTTRSRNRSE